MLLPRLFGPAAEHLVPTRGISGFSRLNLAALLFLTGLASVAAAQVAPTVTVNNLTHPDIAPNFLAGDTYQYIVVGDPNQPVYNVQNSGPMAQVGQTDASGNFQASGVEQAAWAGNYTQTWYIGSAQASPSLSFSVSLAAVVASNLTHPDLSPSFAVGDTYQYTVYGPPNQPVYNIQNSGPRNQVGQTDSTGKYVTSGIEQTAWIGSYTQLWSVGNNTASPALTFVVGQFGSTGEVSTTSTGQTTDGHLQGFSTLSITNGVVTTKSVTTLDPLAKLYYDPGNAATLFDEGNVVLSEKINSTTTILTENATPWHDYDLKTDHFAITAFAYQNPLYWGNSCDGETGDCTIDGSGDYPYWVAETAIYVGSTLADQGYVPDDGSLPPFDLSAYNGFLAGSQPTYPSGITFFDSVTEWIKRIGLVYGPIRLLESEYNPSRSVTVPPIPFYVDLVGDTYDISTAERQRTFVVRDLYGRAWNLKFPLKVRERFSNLSVGGGAEAPKPTGMWYSLLANQPNGAESLDEDSRFTDHHLGTVLNTAAKVNYFQYYYATDFMLPSYLGPIASLLSVPGYSDGLAVPLWIKDTLNRCSSNPDLPAEGMSSNWRYFYVDGDNGPHTGCRAQ